MGIAISQSGTWMNHRPLFFGFSFIFALENWDLGFFLSSICFN